MSKVKNTKKNNAVKNVKKKHTGDEHIVDILLGSMLISTGDFNDGMLLEKIVVLLGFVFLLYGIFKLIPKYKEQNNKGMIILLIVFGVVAIVTLLGLILKLFGLI